MYKKGGVTSQGIYFQSGHILKKNNQITVIHFLDWKDEGQ